MLRSWQGCTGCSRAGWDTGIAGLAEGIVSRWWPVAVVDRPRQFFAGLAFATGLRGAWCRCGAGGEFRPG